MRITLSFEGFDIGKKDVENPDSEGDKHRKEDVGAHSFEQLAGFFGHGDYIHARQFRGQGKDPVDKAGGGGDGVKPANGDAAYYLGDQGADLDADQRAQEHAHGQGVEDEAVDCILAQARITGGEDDLKDVGTHGGGRGNAQRIDEDGE